MTRGGGIMRDFRRPGVLVWLLFLSMAWWTLSMRMEIASHNMMAKQLATYNAREHELPEGVGVTHAASDTNMDTARTSTATARAADQVATLDDIVPVPVLKCPDPEPCPSCPACPACPAAVITKIPAQVSSSSSSLSSQTSSPHPAVPGAVTFVLVATMNQNHGPRAIALLASMQRFLVGLRVLKKRKKERRKIRVTISYLSLNPS